MRKNITNNRNSSSVSYLKHFWEIAKLYWLGEEKFRALGILLVLVLFLLVTTSLGVALNTQQGVIISALAAKETSRFWKAILNFLVILLIYTPLLAVFNYMNGQLGNYWRRWLTHHLLSNYLARRTFYRLVGNSEIDNPDQRISEDIKNFTYDSLKFILLFVGYFLQLIAFSGVLWQIYKPLFWVIIVYGLLGTIFTGFIFGKPLVKLRFDQLRKEADFRFGLIQVRDHAESIAFYRGENQEYQHIIIIFKRVFENYRLVLNWQFFLDLCAKIFAFIPYVIPPVILANQVFLGELEVGKISEAIGAFISVFAAVGFIVEQFQSLTTFGAGVERLYTFSRFMDKQQEDLPYGVEKNQTQKINFSEADGLAVKHLTLLTPNYSKTLLRELSLELKPNMGLLVVGASGCGKSSLLRAIAGLWDSGTGEIIRPNLDNMLFLPQRPYMTLGSLRSQLVYPNNESKNITNDYLTEILQRVNLPNFVEQLDNLEQANWLDHLSAGEQQKIAFARLLIAQPQYAILDEATSALDITNEGNLYNQLINSGSGITYISIGHRPTLEKYHHLVLEILNDGNYRLREPV